VTEQKCHFFLKFRVKNKSFWPFLKTVSDRVCIYEVVPGSLAWRDRRLAIGDHLLKVGSTKVRNSEEAAREISRVKNETQISLTVARTLKSTHPDADRPHLGHSLKFVAKLLVKIDILAKNRNVAQKWKFWSKMEILVKNRNLGQKSSLYE